MNIIYQEREDIIANNNTAQTQIVSILERIRTSGEGTKTNELLINEKLYGTVDFSILEEHGFRNIKTIHFQAVGHIVEITHLPKNLSHLYCSHQLLTEINGLPHGLEVFECNENYLETLDLTTTPKLKILKCANNRLNAIENIPPLMEELICDNNEIRRLDLRSAEKLKVLHCSNNRTIVLEGFPSSVVDFQSENNPLFDPLHFCKTEGELLDLGADDANTTETKLNYKECLYEYFKLKDKYEKKYAEEKTRVFRKAMAKSGNRKRASKMAQRVIPECVNCGRRVKTIFQFKERIYTALCGDTKNPCNLKIRLYAGGYDYDVNTILDNLKYYLEKIKTKIIGQKMETVLDYVKPETAKNNYQILLKEFNDMAKDYEETLTKYEEITYGDIRRNCIREKQTRVYEIIAQIDLVLHSLTTPVDEQQFAVSTQKGTKEYEKVDKNEILRTAVKLQIDELFPEIHNLQLLKYDINEIDIFVKNTEGFGKGGGGGGGGGNTESSTFVIVPEETSVLVQKVLSLEKTERVFNGSIPEIMNFVRK